MGVVIVIAVFAGGIWLMTPPKQQPESAAPAAASGIGSKATDDAIAVISHGSEVDIADHLKEGRTTVVEFSADW